MRAAGMFLGALLMLALFLRVLGTGGSPVPLTGADSAAGPESVVAAPAGAANEPVEHAGDDELAPAAALSVPDEPSTLDAADRGLLVDPQSWNQAMGAHDTVPQPDTAQASRYPVWSPFRSQWAAEGFAQRLTLATDVPVEVINDAPGNYQVVIRYRDEVERQSMVEQIEAMTGLEVE